MVAYIAAEGTGYDMNDIDTQEGQEYPYPVDTWIPGKYMNDEGKASIMLLLDFPADFLYNLKAHMSGDELQLLNITLVQAGIDPRDVYMTFAIPHPVPDRAVTPIMIERCHKHVRLELAKVRPQKLLVMGSAAYTVLHKKEQVQNINIIRGLGEIIRPLDYPLPTVYAFPPYFALGKPDQFRDFTRDIEKFASFTGPFVGPKVHHHVVTSPKDLRKRLRMIDSASVVSCDIETSPMDTITREGGEFDALDPYLALIDAIGFGVMDETGEHVYTIIVPWELIERSSTARIIYDFMFPHRPTPRDLGYMDEGPPLHERTGVFEAEGPYPLYAIGKPRNLDALDGIERISIAEGTRVYTQRSPRMFVFHNGKFDTQFLTLYFRRHGLMSNDGTCHGLPMRDTILMNYLRDERPYNFSPSPHSLKTIARERYDVPFYKYDWKAFWAHPRAERDYADMYYYLSDDLQYTLIAYFEILQELQDEDPCLIDVLDQILVPASQAFADMQLSGVMIDRAYLEEAEAQIKYDMEQEKEAIRRECEDYLIERLGAYDNAQELLNNFFDAYNPRSITHNTWLLYQALGMPKRMWRDSRQGGSEYTTNKVFLKQVQGQYPNTVLSRAIGHIIHYRELGTLLSTYVRGLLNRSEYDGRVHGQYNADGTATGRVSSQNPNLQNIPVLAGPLIRNAFTAPPGWCWVSADFSQLELRVGAWYTQDPDMLQVYFDGRDIHRETASKAFGIPPGEVDDIQRFMAKLINFGAFYGRTPESMAFSPELIGTAWENDVEACRQFMENTMAGYTGFQEWVTAQQNLLLDHFYVVQPSGRKRRFPLITKHMKGHMLRQAINTPIQGTASDVTVFALLRTHMRLKGLKSFLVSTVHDEVNIQTHRSEFDYVTKMVKWVMENELVLPFNVPIKADVEAGKRWGELVKYKPGDPIEEKWFA